MVEVLDFGYKSSIKTNQSKIFNEMINKCDRGYPKLYTLIYHVKYWYSLPFDEVARPLVLDFFVEGPIILDFCPSVAFFSLSFFCALSNFNFSFSFLAVG